MYIALMCWKKSGNSHTCACGQAHQAEAIEVIYYMAQWWAESFKFHRATSKKGRKIDCEMEKKKNFHTEKKINVQLLRWWHYHHREPRAGWHLFQSIHSNEFFFSVGLFIIDSRKCFVRSAVLFRKKKKIRHNPVKVKKTLYIGGGPVFLLFFILFNLHDFTK